MKRMIIVCTTVLVCLAVVSLPLWQSDAIAGSSQNGCKLQGTWIAETSYPLPGNPDYKLKFFAVYDGTGDNEVHRV